MKIVNVLAKAFFIFSLIAPPLLAQYISLDDWGYDRKDALIERLKTVKSNIDDKVEEARIARNFNAVRDLEQAGRNIDRAVRDLQIAGQENWTAVISDVEAGLNEYDLYTHEVYEDYYWDVTKSE
ncbi:MAG: hypothetical protein WC732_01400 [Candidatus Omnitrophota bacterium]